ncbi:hypothetical protein O1611_g6565 [Lasiodiplodia mahajangana]|uniref:Uncharacterized protein n=1 Tax=Lasiodiplodia mahajangana TaxID=1108764 RepID=A0ACC2JHX6_9PEZI|nr:hypothetical protein O1611_g6565 [Lasiodiplodia mahajangana]
MDSKMAFARVSSWIIVLFTTSIILNYAGPYFTIILGNGARKGAGIVSFPLVADSQRSLITRRDDYVDIQLYKNDFSTVWYIELSIGTPPQNVKVRVSTSVAHLWVSTTCERGSSCDPEYGNYNPRNSTTSSHSLGNYTIEYVDDTVIELDYYTDTYALSTGTTLQDVKFGVANRTDYENGVLGLGFPTNEDPSPPIIAQLASQGKTNSKAFSLALSNSSAANGGVVIFGGVDTMKFSGSLSVRQITTDEYQDYTINVDSVGVGTFGDHSVTNLTATNITVTVGSTFGFSYLPDSTLEILSEYFNARISNILNGSYGLSCSLAANSSSFLSFNFASVAIEVPFSAFAVPFDGDLCWWGFQSNTELGGNSALGVNFLQYAYTVFDQTTMTVSLAQYVNCGEHVQEIQSEGARNFVGECPPARDVTQANNSSTGPIPDPPSRPSSDLSSGLSSGAKIGVGVGIAVGVIAAAALVYFALAVKRRRRQANAISSSQNIPSNTPSYKHYPDEMEHPRPDWVLHEMNARRSPIEALGSLPRETTGHTWRQSTNRPSNSHLITAVPPEMLEGAGEANRSLHEIGEGP